MSTRRYRCSGCGIAHPVNDYTNEQMKMANHLRLCVVCEKAGTAPGAADAPISPERPSRQSQLSPASKAAHVAAAPAVPACDPREEMGALRTLYNGAPASKRSATLRKILANRTLYPGNLAMSCLDFDWFNRLPAKDQEEMLWIVHSGTECGNSAVGCYATSFDSYSKFNRFFGPVLAGYHKVPLGSKHVSSWALPQGDSELPQDGKLDLAALGLGPLSMRVRVGRNLKQFPLPAAMTKDDRINAEKKLYEAFKLLIADPAFGGNYYSLTPGHPCFIDDAKYSELVKAHIMFKDMSKDSFLMEAGIARDWPNGRGVWQSADKKCMIWCGEEDHIRAIFLDKGTMLNHVFDRLKILIDKVSSLPGLEFAFEEGFGAITSCPTNLGTAMRASVHIQLPNLCADGTNTKAKAVCKPLGLSVRGMGGEHTPIGADGTVDISPSARYCITEGQIIANLYKGIKRLLAEERRA